MSIRIASTSVNIGTPESVPTPATKAALQRAFEMVALRKKAFSDREVADRIARQAEQGEPERRGRAIAAGQEPGESPVAAAKAAAAAAQDELSGVVAAEHYVLSDLRAAVAADRAAWSASAVTDSQRALLKLTTALRMASEARSELNVSIGVLGMYRYHDQSDVGVALSFRHPRESSQLDLDVGVDSLRAGLSKASNELEQLRPEKKPKKGKKAELTPTPVAEPAEDDDDEF